LMGGIENGPVIAIRAHHAAGADHVCIQVLTDGTPKTFPYVNTENWRRFLRSKNFRARLPSLLLVVARMAPP